MSSRKEASKVFSHSPCSCHAVWTFLMRIIFESILSQCWTESGLGLRIQQCQHSTTMRSVPPPSSSARNSAVPILLSKRDEVGGKLLTVLHCLWLWLCSLEPKWREQPLSEECPSVLFSHGLQKPCFAVLLSTGLQGGCLFKATSQSKEQSSPVHNSH